VHSFPANSHYTFKWYLPNSTAVWGLLLQGWQPDGITLGSGGWSGRLRRLHLGIWDVCQLQLHGPAAPSSFAQAAPGHFHLRLVKFGGISRLRHSGDHRFESILEYFFVSIYFFGVQNDLTHSLIAIVTGDSTEDGDIGTTGHHPEITWDQQFASELIQKINSNGWPNTTTLWVFVWYLGI
jgi:hypothetical protein